MSKPSAHPRCQTFSGILINHIRNPKGNPVVGAGLHKIITPDMLRKERFQSDHRTIVEPQPPSFRLYLRNFQPFSPPDPLHTFVVNNPTFVPQQSGHPAVAVASVFTGQLNDPFSQDCLIVSWAFIVPLGCSWLSHHPTGSAFRHIQRLD